MYMYLVGDLSMRDYFDIDTKFITGQDKIKEHMAKAAKNSSYQVIDIINKKYFDPDSNSWKDIKSE